MTARARPYHHGNLRDALLDAAERSLADRGVEQLSLRELARTAGVSHAAPRTHFGDRQALLDALAERGFEQLTLQMHAAYDESEPIFNARLRATITAVVTFAAGNAALLELMFAHKGRPDGSGPQRMAADALSVVPALIQEGIDAGALAPGDPDRYALLLAANIRGIAVLVTGANLSPGAIGALITDTATTFIRGNKAQL